MSNNNECVYETIIKLDKKEDLMIIDNQSIKNLTFINGTYIVTILTFGKHHVLPNKRVCFNGIIIGTATGLRQLD